MNKYEVDTYATRTGKKPYIEWVRTLDKAAAARIAARISRIKETGNFGVCEPVGMEYLKLSSIWTGLQNLFR